LELAQASQEKLRPTGSVEGATEKLQDFVFFFPSSDKVESRETGVMNSTAPTEVVDRGARICLCPGVRATHSYVSSRSESGQFR
jgi:hypothetical protein